MERTDIPAIGLMKQYLVSRPRASLYDDARRFNYARALGNVQVPILISCGSLDRFAPPPVQKYLYDHVGSPGQDDACLRPAQGFAADSGHDDALVGLTSRQQMFPLIERWLRGEKLS